VKVRRCVVALILFLLSGATLVAGACTQVFSAISFSGAQYPVQSTLNYPPPIVSGGISLNLEFHTVMDAVVSVSGVSLRYTVDNQPAGPVLTDNFASILDTTQIPDGTHSLSVLYINEPATLWPCYTFLGRQYSFVVSNSGRAITGPQLLPVVAPLAGYGPVLPQYADSIAFPGSQSHPISHPFPAQIIAPAGGVTPSDLWSEPLLFSTSNTGESIPSYWQLRNGSIVEDPLFSSLIGCDDLRQPRWGFDVAGPIWEQRKGHFDGLQDDVSASSYATFTPNPDGPGFYGISMDGRLFLLGTDGSIRTLTGWVTNRNVIPLHYEDGSIPLASVHGQQTLVGNFDAQFYFPTDLAVDPTNHSHIFVADMNNHRVALVDLSQSPPVISTYAGVTGHAGYLNGPAATSLFNQPSSIAIASDRTIYVADAENGLIRKIDPSGNVTTLVGLGPGYEPANNVIAAAPLTYAPRTTVPFASAFINYPNALRFDSKGNLVLAETVSQAIRYVDLTAQTVTTIAQFSNVGNTFGEQVWLDVDHNGNIGEKDDIIASMVTGKQNGLYRVPITGTTAIPLPTITTHSTNPLASGHTRQNQMPWTSGPWSVAIDDQEGRLVVSGVQSAGVTSLRLVQSTDPAFRLQLADYTAGKNVWLTGTVPNFPFGSRPAFAAVHGYEGHSALGNVLNFDDMIAMTDAQLGTYLQNGADGSVPRPELTGNDLRNVIYYIRRTTTGGDLATPAPDNPDQTTPAITTIAASQNGSTGATVTWTTNKPTLGFVAWGTTSGTYFGWSPLESGYSTAHSLSPANLPAGQQIYFVVRAKDQAGNQSVSAEQGLPLR
jgi:hypothetical protein